MKLITKIKKFKKQTSLGVTILIVIGIITAINILSYQLFVRLDLTKNKDYSLSPVSKATAQNLSDIVNVKVYFSKQLPTQYINLTQEVTDVLDEYQNYSKGKIKVEFIDPASDSTIKSDLQAKGIPELQFNVLEKDKYQVVNGYLGMVISYGDKSESIPVIQDTNNLEYQLTANLKKLTAKSMPIIGYVTSNKTLDPQNEVGKAFKALSGLYEVRQVDLATDKKIGTDISTLIIAGPKEKFNDDEQKAIDAFVMRGGSMLLLVDGVNVDNGLAATSNDLGLDKLLDKYGLKLNHNLVLDVSTGQASFSQGFLSFMVDYPFWPKVLKGGFDANNTISTKLESLILPWVSSVDVVSNNLDANAKIAYLVKSTNQAWLQAGPFNLNPQQAINTTKTSAQYNLAVEISGKFNSAFGKTNSTSSKMIVVGDSDFLKDNFLSAGDNLTFFQNMVDGLSLDDALISIRAKGITDHPFAKTLSDSDKQITKYLNIFGLTLLAVGFGIYRYYSRKRYKLEDEE